MKRMIVGVIFGLICAAYGGELPMCIPNKKTAEGVSEIILSAIFGSDRIQKQMPLVVSETKDTWIVKGTMKSSARAVGGVATIEIAKRDGRVMKVYHGR